MDENTLEFQKLQVMVASLKRRVDHIDHHIFGKRVHERGVLDLLNLYERAYKGPEYMNKETALLWSYVADTLDEYDLFKIWKETEDPFPWRPFLVLLDQFTQRGFGAYTERPAERLLRVARSMLGFQGLRLLKPEDVLLARTRAEEAKEKAYQLPERRVHGKEKEKLI